MSPSTLHYYISIVSCYYYQKTREHDTNGFLTSGYPVVNHDSCFSSQYRPSRTLKMIASINKILEAVPHSSIPPIIGQPTYYSTHEIHQFLSSNAASVQSNLGCGTMGLIYLTLSPTVYATLSATLFVPPPNPGDTATIPPHRDGLANLLHPPSTQRIPRNLQRVRQHQQVIEKAPHWCC